VREKNELGGLCHFSQPKEAEGERERRGSFYTLATLQGGSHAIFWGGDVVG
jgi:hypothetical protein